MNISYYKLSILASDKENPIIFTMSPRNRDVTSYFIYKEAAFYSKNGIRTLFHKPDIHQSFYAKLCYPRIRKLERRPSEYFTDIDDDEVQSIRYHLAFDPMNYTGHCEYMDRDNQFF